MSDEDKKQDGMINEVTNDLLDVVYGYKDRGIKPYSAMIAVFGAVRMIQRVCGADDEDMATIFESSKLFLKCEVVESATKPPKLTTTEKAQC